MERLHYESSPSIGSPSSHAATLRESVRRQVGAPARFEPEPAGGEFRGVPLTASVTRAMDSYSLAGTLTALFAFVGGALAYRGVVEDDTLMQPLAALAIIASVTTFVGMRIRLLSVMEEACVDHGLGEADAHGRARDAMSELGRRRR